MPEVLGFAFPPNGMHEDVHTVDDANALPNDGRSWNSVVFDCSESDMENPHGRGSVEPVDDAGHQPTGHQELLEERPPTLSSRDTTHEA